MLLLLPRTHFCAVVLICLIGLVGPARASAVADNAAATRLIQAQLPRGTDLLQADRDTLARAVGQATMEHRPQAVAILSAALSGAAHGKGTAKANKLSCEFVVGVFKAALLAAPEQASALTETAAALYPDCEDQLDAALRDETRRLAAYDYKDRGDYKDRADYKDRGNYKDTTGQPVAGINDPGIEVTDFGFGIGFGPGFPGSPGFVGSPPSGGFALPPVALPTPGASPVTSVVNQ